MSAELAQKIEEALPMVTVGKGVDWTDHEQTACALSVIYQQIKEPKARHKQTIQRIRELVRKRDQCEETNIKKAGVLIYKYMLLGFFFILL